MENQAFVDRSDAIGKLGHNGYATSFMLGVAAFALGQALRYGNGFSSVKGFVLLTISLIFAAGSLLSTRLHFPPIFQKEFFYVFLTGLVWQ